MKKIGNTMELTTAAIITLWMILPHVSAGETLLSTILTPKEGEKDQKLLSRQSRSRYYDPYEPRYGAGRQFLERLVDRPRCGRCLDDRYDDRDDNRDEYYDRANRDRYDDDRRGNHKPTYGNRYDRNDRNQYDRNDDDDRYNDRRGADKTNGTTDESGDDKKNYDDKDERRPSGGRRGSNRDRERDRNRNRYDDRDRYRPDYYDRFLRDPERNRDPYRERDYQEDPYRERRPLYERPPYDRYPYDRYDDGYGYYDNRRPAYNERGNGYDDRGFGRGRGPHDRPWDETYRGQSGWDDGGRGYYFASGRPEVGAVPTWGANRDYYFPREYVRPEPTVSGWQNVNRQLYNQGYNQGGQVYPQNYGYRQEYDDGSRVGSGWQNVRPYRDQSAQVPKRGSYGQQNHQVPNSYGQNNNVVSSSSTTPGTSYLYQREDEHVTSKDDVTTNPST